jgi:pterin-4a-carbinolamine dehydratase
MNELNLSISTGKDNENRVVLTAVFSTHDEAVAFHSQVAALCNSAKQKPGTFVEVSKIGKTGLLPNWARS